MRTINEILKDLDKLYSDADQKDKPEEDVYHYTKNYENLMSILKSRKLFMSYDKGMNNGEYEYTIKCLKKLIPQVKLPHKIVEAELTEFWQSLEWYLKEKIKGYWLSFCLSRDEPHMWRSFGSYGNGFAIRFSKDYFKCCDQTNLNLNRSSSHPIIARTKISYEDEKTKEGYLQKLAELINELLGILRQENQADILVESYQRIVAWLPKFLTPKSNLHYEQEYRCYSFYDHLSIDPDAVTLNGKQGIYTPGVPFKYIKEIIVGSTIEDFNKIRERIKYELKTEFPNDEFGHIEITQSKVKLMN